MQLTTALLALLPFLTAVQADYHNLCACTSGKNLALHDYSTEQCCKNWNSVAQTYAIAPKIDYPGQYCGQNKISGDKWTACCKSFGGSNGYCPW
ncbi:hypothetical protein MPH_07341 [Macrophomina phaseolina MS6]|uniref:Uncharacterized protein n=2 Tax=Macrophomina phaseolina TaxID=35725 RepID=K2SF66_MACPH|nr:hypothetical protein MPH_07341 [Macrophomina phaseolina MS6]KAH7048387.1 hypothetical protein B0J12DRAFT_741120 [Macrophomina phaseolina]